MDFHNTAHTSKASGNLGGLAGQIVPNSDAPRKEYLIDAKDKRLGKVATEAASLLIGKDRVDFSRNTVAPVTVKVINAAAMDIPAKHKEDVYKTYSGYPSGQKEETLEHLGKRLGYSEVLRRTVNGMLPKNKLQKLLMKNLSVSE